MAANPPIATPGVKILHVEAGSIAERQGIVQGDALVALSGHLIDDLLDYWFHVSADRLKVEWRTASGEVKSAKVRKGFDERLGLELEPFEIKRCRNNCVFCFVHQLPQGMRRELYIKDEDYRLSFLYGNYITGTNLSPADIKRIIDYKLSPLFFSIHATDQEVREQLLAKKNIEPIVPLLRRLTDENIFINGQIVLCPGVNDGDVLRKTALDLAPLYPKLESLAIVPLGLTDHRGRLPTLDQISSEYARQFLEGLVPLQEELKGLIGYPLVFPSDEFYLIAGMTPPSYKEYPEIPQFGNGVGMYFKFYQYLEELLAEVPQRLEQPYRVAALTGALGAQVLERLVRALNERVENLQVDLVPLENSLFGRGITVSGLLPGSDFLEGVRANPGYDRYLVPDNAMRQWDRRFIDDMTWDEFVTAAGVEMATGTDTAESFISACLETATLEV